MIPVKEESSTATKTDSSRTQVTRTTTLFKEIPQPIPLGELSSAHHLVKILFCNLKIPTVPLAGRLVHFLGSWGKLKKNQNILQIVQGYQILFLCRPEKGTKGNKLFNAREGSNIIRSEKSLEEWCCRASLSSKRPISEQCIYSEKKDAGSRPVINLN